MAALVVAAAAVAVAAMVAVAAAVAVAAMVAAAVAVAAVAAVAATVAVAVAANTAATSSYPTPTPRTSGGTLQRANGPLFLWLGKQSHPEASGF